MDLNSVENLPVEKILAEAIRLQQSADMQGAERLFLLANSKQPGNAAAAYSLGVIALNRGQPDQARAWALAGLKVTTAYAPLHFLAAAAIRASGGALDRAIEFYDQAIALQPDYVEALINCGVLLREAFRHKEALERFQRVLDFRPDYPTALLNAGVLLTEFKRNDKAIELFERLLTVQPDSDYGLGMLLFEKLHVCDWRNYDGMLAEILERTRAGRRACKSLPMMAFSDDCQIQAQSARVFSAHLYPTNPNPLWRGETYRHDKIRLAYLSPDLREHPVGHLIAGVIEHHDKARFEITGLSLGIEDDSRIRQRLRGAFDRFIDVQQLNSAQIAHLVRSLEIDILVDLGAFTADSRPDVLSAKPAPVQVNYLGYCGTVGGSHMDYIIADPLVVPPAHWSAYAEKVAYLPDSYLPVDDSIVIGKTLSRSEYGLPEDGFVFCAFNHDFKINPQMFAVWMSLLAKVPGSVLWLQSRHPLSQQNLRAFALAAGVDPVRLIYASRVPRVEDHLARYRAADLFLDTFPYNAHSTAADVLMAGLPLVTCMGNAFPARVAGSLLIRLGLAELATNSLSAYEAMATRLATQTDLLAEVKAQLAAQRTVSPIFDTARYTRGLETTFLAMWRKSQLETPDAL